MEVIWDKLGAIIGAIITALGGFYMYDRKVTHERLNRVEQHQVEDRVDIRVIQSQYKELKEDLQEIKDQNVLMLKLLTSRRK